MLGDSFFFGLEFPFGSTRARAGDARLEPKHRPYKKIEDVWLESRSVVYGVAGTGAGRGGMRWTSTSMKSDVNRAD